MSAKSVTPKVGQLLISSMLAFGASMGCAEDGTGLQMGPFRVKPTIGLTFGHDSNVAQTNTDEVSSFFTLISPGVRLDSGNEARSFSLAYEIEAGRFSDSSPDDFTDQRLSAGVKLSPTVRNRFDLAASTERGHDRRGSNARQGTFTNATQLNSTRTRDVDRWRRNAFDVGYDFGAPGARGALGLSAGISDVSYLNNRDYTFYGDRSMRYVGGDFGWRIAPKTRAFVAAKQSEIEYDDPRLRANRTAYTLDSTEREFSAGLQFDATARTSGKVSVGRLRKDFDDASLGDFSGTIWDVGLQYRIRSYSVLDFVLSRRTQEAVNFLNALDTDFTLSRNASIAWSHSWTDRFKTGLDFGLDRLDYVTANAVQRSDDFSYWGASADYRMRDWLSVGLGYKSYQRDADTASATGGVFDFDRDELVLSFEASL